MRKLLALLLALSLLAVALSGCGRRKENPASDFEYSITEDGGVLITKYVGNDLEVVIPQKIERKNVIGIGEKAFYQSNIQSLVMPDTITKIGNMAFCESKSLTNVTFSKGLVGVEFSAFSNCTALKNADLSSTQVKLIDAFAFRGCKNLKEVTFSNTLVEIREKAFYECSALLEVDFPQSLIKIEGGAFAYCASLKRVAIPSKLDLTSLDEATFHNVPSIEQVIFKEGREEIIGYALLQTDASVEIIVPEGVKRFSPLPFLINPSTHITITFLGDAPEIVDDDTDWFGTPVINYDQNTNGWNEFSWNEKFTVKPIQKN